VIICIAEDRGSFGASIKLLLLSLAKFSPTYPIHLVFPPATHEFEAWLQRYGSVTFVRNAISSSSGVNIKPDVLLSLFDQGHDEAIWIDSDIIVTQDISPLFGRLDPNTLVITEEALSGRYYDYGGQRAQCWGLSVGRILPFAVNSGIIRATKAHRPLLQRWRELMQSSEYRDAHRLNWANRPWHMFTDQDVLTALLSSIEFSDVPIKTLRRGTDIIQYFGPLGYTVTERLANLLGRGPTFIHSQGPKPWDQNWEKPHRPKLNLDLRKAYLDVSPYTVEALKYRAELSGDESRWMEPHLALSKVLRAAGLWKVPLVGLPLALLWDIYEIPTRISRYVANRRSYGRSNGG